MEKKNHKTHRKYDPQFRQEALKQVESGRSVCLSPLIDCSESAKQILNIKLGKYGKNKKIIRV
jgi:hypothetical protein